MADVLKEKLVPLAYTLDKLVKDLKDDLKHEFRKIPILVNLIRDGGVQKWYREAWYDYGVRDAETE